MNLKQQSCSFVLFLQPISSVSTEQWHIGATTSLGKQQHLVLKINLKIFPPDLVSYFTKHDTWDPWAQGDLAQKRGQCEKTLDM